ncbi:MAG: sugar phosphate isomerase/epimerase family protein [Terriglobia bacterium]
METRIARRKFLQATAMAAAASGLPSVRGEAAQGSPEVTEQQVAKTPRLLTGCCAYSYRKYLQHGPMTMEDFIRNAVKLRLDGVDMTAYYYKSTEPAYLASLRHLAYKMGVPFSGAACGVSMVRADASARVQALEEIKKWVDAADQLGASHLRVFAGKLPQGANMQQAVGWVVETMKPACDYAGRKGIMVGVEDHSGVTQNSEVCLEIMHRVNSPYAGINLDITHFIPTHTQDAYAQIAACIPYATNTHIRDHFDNGDPLDMDRVWRMFARAGFKGYMSAEYEGRGQDPITGVPQLIDKIRTLNKEYSSV